MGYGLAVSIIIVEVFLHLGKMKRRMKIELYRSILVAMMKFIELLY
jgi:hypothetical protein